MSRIDSQQTAIQSNSGAQLSVRSRIHKPQDGVGFAHGSADVELKQLDEWIERQPTAIHRALNDPNAELIITGRTSGTGSLEINEALSHRRAEEVAKLLPPTSGFFFGGKDIDQFYLEDVRMTVEVLEQELNGEESDAEYYYRASW